MNFELQILITMHEYMFCRTFSSQTFEQWMLPTIAAKLKSRIIIQYARAVDSITFFFLFELFSVCFLRYFLFVDCCLKCEFIYLRKWKTESNANRTSIEKKEGKYLFSRVQNEIRPMFTITRDTLTTGCRQNSRCTFLHICRSSTANMTNLPFALKITATRTSRNEPTEIIYFVVMVRTLY